MCSYQGIEGGALEQSLDLGLVDCSFERALGQSGREVEDGSLGCRDRDAVHGRGLEVRCAMGANPRSVSATGARDADVDQRGRGGADLPQCGRRGVAQRRARPAGEHGGEPVTVARQQRMADGVDALVQPMKLAGHASPADRGLGESESGELPARDDAVLARRQRRDRLVYRTRDEFCSLSEHFSWSAPGWRHGRHGAPSQCHEHLGVRVA
jgi:hypothetical protein